LAPVSETVPPVASTVSAPAPVMLPLSTGARALRLKVLLPVAVKVCSV
jgi:hypothetical protein